jgi:hypothetical protein
MKTTVFLSFVFTSLLVIACNRGLQEGHSGHQEMIEILNMVRTRGTDPENSFSSEAKLAYTDSLLGIRRLSPERIVRYEYNKANILLELDGRELEAIKLLERLEKESKVNEMRFIRRSLAIAYMRLGERSNCIEDHAAESCIMPIRNLGVHAKPEGSQKAIALYRKLLEEDPNDLESMWLLNIAYMTLGEYPGGVPKQYLIPGLDSDTAHKVKPFEDVAGDLGLDLRSTSGGSIIEDFDNDGFLDIMVSAWDLDENVCLFRNLGNGRFEDLTDKSGLKGITGGLNMLQGDYDNDGYADVLVLRGAWKGKFGNEPNSLLRNNGNGTFTDVTTTVGLLSFHPTQTAVWADFDNDGWLDIFIGNETSSKHLRLPHPCELYMNNKDGTFREIAAIAGCDVLAFVKGVTADDYDNDGWQDIFISTMDGRRILLKNEGRQGEEIAFADVTNAAGLDKDGGRTFPAWFWDYDNDGWVDIFTTDYSFEEPLSASMAAEYLGTEAATKEKMLLYRNNRDGTFTNVAQEVGLDKTVYAMGANFGDIDNDGYLDMYLGTGNPGYQSLVPNKMFKNLEGKMFADVTTSARVGHLQKGHGVSFGDVDNDGDQDIHIEMGGAYPGDAYQNAFFLNPGQNDNRWISIKLVGTKSNRAAIGSRVKVTFRENGVQRAVYRTVNSGGSFGASTLRREIGLGQATIIDEIEIRWHGSGTVQTFRNVKPNQFITITEGIDKIVTTNNKTVDWILPNRLCFPGAPTTPDKAML